MFQCCCCCLVTKLCPILFDPMWPQATVLEWVAISFSRGTSQSRAWTRISCNGRRLLYQWATSEAPAPCFSVPGHKKSPANGAYYRQLHLPVSSVTEATPGIITNNHGSIGKESACKAGDQGSIPGSRRSPGEGNGNHSSILAWKIPWIEESISLLLLNSLVRLSTDSSKLTLHFKWFWKAFELNWDRILGLWVLYPCGVPCLSNWSTNVLMAGSLTEWKQ